MRYFVDCSFLGTNFVGWQRQPNGVSVQSAIEEQMSTFLRTPVGITGCGRTDAGVHAMHFVFHFDIDTELPDDFLYRINQMLPGDIALHGVSAVATEMHARHSATGRTYEYYMHFDKDPFSQLTSVYYPRGGGLAWDKMEEACRILTQHQEFKPFCKSGSDTPHFLCDLEEAAWHTGGPRAVFTITANRFLRGMVRLIVGTMLQVGLGSFSLEELERTLQEQSPLKRAESAPPHGLLLARVRYD